MQLGQKGIGFKSVFRVTDSPEIHSNGFHIRFDVNSGPLGYIMPHWIDTDQPDCDEYVVEFCCCSCSSVEMRLFMLPLPTNGVSKIIVFVWLSVRCVRLSICLSGSG